MRRNIIFFGESILYGYAQIFFSNRKWFGALILLSTFLIPEIGILGLSGVVISNIIAIYLKYDKEKIKNGFYGFNGILIGCAIAYFFELTPFLIVLTIVFIIITFFISSALEHLLANVFNLPGLSLPFIFTLHIFLIFISNYDNIIYKGLNFADSAMFDAVHVYIADYFKVLGLIVFQSNVFSGMIIFIAILFFSRTMLVNTIFTYAVNFALLHLLYPQFDRQFFILTSFNAILVSFALGGSLILISRKTFGLLILSTIFVIVFTAFFSKLLTNYFLPVLVLPFNFIVLSALYSLKFREQHSDFVLLYFKPGSPEENHYYHQNRKSRFERFKFLLAELPFWGEWKVSQGFDGKITHKESWKYAWDFVITDEDGNEFNETGQVPDDYYCFSTPVVAPLDGQVVKVVDNVQDNDIGEFNLENNWGNSVVIDHGEGLFSQLSHLKRSSIKVKIGDEVKKGEIIGQCGNSGRSPTPHLHFQFQLTDRIGDKTYRFPLSNYLVNKDGELLLKSFDFPEEGALVRNIETHKVLKKAFNLQYGDELEFVCKLNGKEFNEKWEVKVDMLNQTYFESNRGSKAYFYRKDKVFLMTDFIGERKSALYYFYLLALRTPFGYYENLCWEDEIPVSLTVDKKIRFFSEFILMFDQQVESSLKSRFESKDNSGSDFQILTELENRGKRLFSFVKEKGHGALIIASEGYIKNMTFSIGNVKFEANKLIKGEGNE